MIQNRKGRERKEIKKLAEKKEKKNNQLKSVWDPLQALNFFTDDQTHYELKRKQKLKPKPSSINRKFNLIKASIGSQTINPYNQSDRNYFSH